MSCMDGDYINLESLETQGFTMEGDDGPVREASSSSYDFTEGDTRSPYIISSSLS